MSYIIKWLDGIDFSQIYKDYLHGTQPRISLLWGEGNGGHLSTERANERTSSDRYGCAHLNLHVQGGC